MVTGVGAEIHRTGELRLGVGDSALSEQGLQAVWGRGQSWGFPRLAGRKRQAVLTFTQGRDEHTGLGLTQQQLRFNSVLTRQWELRSQPWTLFILKQVSGACNMRLCAMGTNRCVRHMSQRQGAQSGRNHEHRRLWHKEACDMGLQAIERKLWAVRTGNLFPLEKVRESFRREGWRRAAMVERW